MLSRRASKPRRRRRPRPEDLLKVPVSQIVRKVTSETSILRQPDWDHEDMVQEVVLKAMLKLSQFRGDSSLTTWTYAIARNHLLTLAARRLRGPGLLGERDPRGSVQDPARRMILRGTTKELLAWLRENPSEIERGWEVLNLLLWSGGNYSYVALAMTIHTRTPWTTEATRNVIRKIQQTPRGRALCEALGIGNVRKD